VENLEGLNLTNDNQCQNPNNPNTNNPQVLESESTGNLVESQRYQFFLRISGGTIASVNKHYRDIL